MAACSRSTSESSPLNNQTCGINERGRKNKKTTREAEPINATKRSDVIIATVLHAQKHDAHACALLRNSKPNKSPYCHISCCTYCLHLSSVSLVSFLGRHFIITCVCVCVAGFGCFFCFLTPSAARIRESARTLNQKHLPPKATPTQSRYQAWVDNPAERK